MVRFQSTTTITTSKVWELPDGDGSDGQVLKTNGAQVLSWTDLPTEVTPAGANTQIQFNDSGSFGASGSLVWNGTQLSVTGAIEAKNFNELRFYDDGSNYVGFEAPALTADQIWVLPSADGSDGQFLKTNG
jgi:hypothetical protein